MATGYPEQTRPRVPAVLRAPLEGRTWREFLYLILNLPTGVVCFTFAVAMLSCGAGLLITFLGVPVLAAMLAGCLGLGHVERARARGLLRLDVADPEPVRRGRGLMGWVGGLFRSGVSWRHVLYAFLLFPWGVFTFCVCVVLWTYGWAALTYPLWQWVFPAYVHQPGLQLYGDVDHSVYLDGPFKVTLTALAGLLLVLGTPWVIRGLTAVDRLMVRGLLGPSRLATRVHELETDRGTVVDTAAADLRRIERDLHDG
ncbi:sensor domain-containing protein, partial [Streptantibioticus rubrisoli]